MSEQEDNKSEEHQMEEGGHDLYRNNHDLIGVEGIIKS